MKFSDLSPGLNSGYKTTRFLNLNLRPGPKYEGRQQSCSRNKIIELLFKTYIVNTNIYILLQILERIK